MESKQVLESSTEGKDNRFDISLNRWRRWRRSMFDRSSSTTSATPPLRLAEFTKKAGFEGVLQVFPPDMLLSHFASLQDSDILHVRIPILRKQVVAAIGMARLQVSNEVHPIFMRRFRAKPSII